MPKSSSTRKYVNEIAASIVSRATKPAKVDKNPYAVALGRLGGLKGGRARAEKLSPERHKEIAVKGARAGGGRLVRKYPFL